MDAELIVKRVQPWWAQAQCKQPGCGFIGAFHRDELRAHAEDRARTDLKWHTEREHSRSESATV